MFKKYFWPHQANHFQPRFLHPGWLLAILALLVGLQFFGHLFYSGQAKVLGDVSQISRADVVELINRERGLFGIYGVAENPALTAAAQAKASDMFAKGYWDHNAPDGSPPWVFIDQQQYRFAKAGENLARDFVTSAGVVKGWMASRPHKLNLLDEDFTEVGIAVESGLLAGQETTLVVAMLAQPAAALRPATALGSTTQSFASANSPVSFSLVNPLSPADTLNWIAKAAVPLLGLMTLLYLSQHLVIRAHHLRWDKGLHRHPLVLATGLLAVTGTMVVTSFGTIL